MPAVMRDDDARLSKAMLRDIEDALQVAGLEEESELQLAPDFAGVVADVRDVLTVPEIAEATGVKERQVHHWANGSHSPKGDARDRLLVLRQVIGQLKLTMGNEQIKVWLFSPQPEVGGRPIDFITTTGDKDVLGAARALSLRSSLDDKYLVEIAQHGNASAYDELVRRYRGFVRLKASSYFLLGGDADDLVQEGLLGLYKAIRDFRGDREASFRNFAELCITRQLIIAVKNAVRERRLPAKDRVSASQASHDHPDDRAGRESSRGANSEPPSQMLASEELERLVSRLSGASGVLSELEGRVLSLYLDGYSYQATAEQVGCDMKTVDAALQRVKQKVGKLLASGNLANAESSV